MINSNVQFNRIYPDNSISDFIECFWLVDNRNSSDKRLAVSPDGNFDLVITKEGKLLEIFLMGLNTKVHDKIIQANTRIFIINFKLFATEYLFNQ